MALADYRLCDVCGGKAFYDANLNYEQGINSLRAKPYRIGGEEQYDDAKMLEQYGNRLDYLGDWAVICNGCATKYRTKIVPITEST